MMEDEKIPVEVLTYVQSVINYLENNETAYDYFIGSNSKETFINLLKDVAVINFNQRSEPQLTKEQFEILRLSTNIFDKIENNEMPEDSIYEYIPNHLKFYLK